MINFTLIQRYFTLFEEAKKAIKTRSFRLYTYDYKVRMLSFREQRLKDAKRNISFLKDKISEYEGKDDEIAFIAFCMLERERALIYFLEGYNE